MKTIENINHLDYNNVSDISERLQKVFWMTKDKVNKLTLGEKWEINKLDLKLAKIFWKLKEIQALNKRELSLAQVEIDMEEYFLKSLTA